MTKVYLVEGGSERDGWAALKGFYKEKEAKEYLEELKQWLEDKPAYYGIRGYEAWRSKQPEIYENYDYFAMTQVEVQ